MNQAHYIEERHAWLLPSIGAGQCEVLVAGDRAAPSARCLALTEEAVRSLGHLQQRAATYLDEFVDRKKFATDSDWYLEGFECGLAGQGENQFTLTFSLEGDTYGRWSVTFQISNGKYFPIALDRRQI